MAAFLREGGMAPAAQMQQMAGEHWLLEGFCAFAADGSQFDCPRTQANLAGLDSRGKDPLRPSLYMTGLYHLGLGRKAVAMHRVGDRPDRIQPRAHKRRPAQRYLTEPRKVARERLRKAS